MPLLTPNWVVILVCAVVSVIRICGIKTVAFQAIAHILVGYLLGVFLSWGFRFYLWCLIAIAVVETACFFLIR